MLRLGDRVENYGTVAAVGWTGGERDYWFVDGHVVSMMPASMFEEETAIRAGVTREEGHDVVGYRYVGPQ